MKDIYIYIYNSVGNNKSSTYTVLSHDIIVSDPPRPPFSGVYVNVYNSPLSKGSHHLHFTDENTEA